LKGRPKLVQDDGDQNKGGRLKRRMPTEADQSSFTGGILVNVSSFVQPDAIRQGARAHKRGTNKTGLNEDVPKTFHRGNT